MNQWGNNYNILYAQNSVKATLVFILGTTVYLRTRNFRIETITFIQLSFSLGWLIEFYILSPDEKLSFTITYAMLLTFPVFLFLFYCSFINFKSKIIIFLGTFFILLANIFDPSQLPLEYSLVASILLCFLLFFRTQFISSYRNWKYQKIFLITLLVAFIPYLILQNIFRILSEPPEWLGVIIYEYQLPNYFLLIFPVVLSYKLIKNNELEFTLRVRDYLIQVFITVGLISLVSLFFLQIMNVPYGTLLILLLSTYLVYFIILNLQKQFFLYRYRKLETERTFIHSERTLLKNTISYSEYLNTLSELISSLIISVYQPNGICLIQNHENHLMIFTEYGTLEKIKLTKEFKKLLAKNSNHLEFKNKKLSKIDLIYSKNIIGWILLDNPTNSPEMKVIKKITKLLLLTDELEKRQTNFVPEYVSIYKDTLKDTTYLRKMEQLRKEISYYLHDDILQNILALKNISELAAQEPLESEKNLIMISKELGNMNDKVREKMFDLYPSSLMDLTFNQSITILINQLIEMKKKKDLPTFSINIDTNIDIPKELRFTVYRMLKELINNAIKYSHANNIQIEILDHHKTLQISVCDDGVGFDLKEKTKNMNSGFGLLSVMQEVDSLSGQIQIKSNYPTGTIIEIILNNERN
ncbi:putative Histidine kinase [Carnobacterium maltaromaticum]|uniref:sensor histidine kinase n=1 Tax=Carnobacterium maltaromaticum TaxID=2751 RepID=UPI00191BBF10|nr:ATP-binding protein [Carnobacterium maltaromaticum]CAD5901013.1 putative Histidine kinase [Carnobacterium maltaromaticum]